MDERSYIPPTEETKPQDEPSDEVVVQTDDDVEQVVETPAEPAWHEPEPYEPGPAYDEPVEPAYMSPNAPAVRRDEPRLLPFALTWLIAAILGAGIGAGAMLFVAERTDVGGGEVKVVRPPVTNTRSSEAGSAAAVAKAVLPSIVRLDVSQTFQGGVGSGVIYDDAGHIITNDHVVAGASRIDVNLPNGETVEGRVVGTAAPFVDIAVVKIDAQNLQPATFGSSKSLEVGEMAVALGSPFGLEATVTAGVISALHRNPTLDAQRPLTDAIQTDAPINPGNSGGALANARGEVIGINTAILGSEGNVGVGFAIPVDIALKVARQIIETGRAELAYLGIQGASIPDGGGARVIDVSPADGPAGRAGIRPDDVIVEMDGRPVDSMNTLITLITTHDVGDEVQIVVERNGRRVTVRARLQARPTG